MSLTEDNQVVYFNMRAWNRMREKFNENPMHFQLAFAFGRVLGDELMISQLVIPVAQDTGLDFVDVPDEVRDSIVGAYRNEKEFVGIVRLHPFYGVPVHSEDDNELLLRYAKELYAPNLASVLVSSDGRVNVIRCISS